MRRRPGARLVSRASCGNIATAQLPANAGSQFKKKKKKPPATIIVATDS